ncbi:MAG: DUF3343 domain-containing protein [Ruminococcaceae bacterium]|nr:DUF3343 domain-containing protein [Oscillospiraceae bacterium]
MQSGYYGCLAVMGSMTQAMHAQKVLAAAAVRAEVVKADSAHTRRGCAYALSYPCSQENNVRTILSGAGIRVRDYYREDADDLSR